MMPSTRVGTVLVFGFVYGALDEFYQWRSLSLPTFPLKSETSY